MTDVNHLQEAKNWTERATMSESGDQGSMADIGKNHALIYIAEQLAIQNQPENLCQSCSHLEMYCPMFKETKTHNRITTDCTSHEEDK